MPARPPRRRSPACLRAASRGRGTLLAVAAAVLASAMPAQAQSLADLESAALEHAQPLRVADVQAEIAVQQLAAARAQQGAHVMLGTALSQNREPITDTVARDYARTSGLAGLRWPLLGTAETAARDTEDATLRLEQQPWRRRQAQAEVLAMLRTAYVALLHGRERQALAHAWLQQQPQVEALLSQRTRAHLLLATDRLAFASMFDAARRDELHEAQEADRALLTLRRLTLLPLADLQPARPGWITGCLRTEDVLAGANDRPAIAMAIEEMHVRERQVDEARWSGMEAGVTLSQSATHDFGGLNGYSTTLGVDVSMPLDWQAFRNAQRAQRRLALDEARHVVQARREDDAARVQEVLDTLSLAAAQARAGAQSLSSAHEGVRIARLRAATLEGDVLEHAVQARYALYRAAMDASEALQRYEQAQAAALVYATGTPCAQGTEDALAPLPATLAGELVEPLPVRASASAAPTSNPGAGAKAADAAAPRAGSVAAAMPSAQPVAWLAWQGERLLDAPDPAALLPSPPARLLVSFEGAELARFAGDARAAQRLRACLEALHGGGWRIELLLGEPTWVEPSVRPRLLALLRGLASFPFDGLALDLERSQLPAAEQHHWSRRLVTTMRQVHGVDPRPLTLVTHWRDLAARGVGAELKQAGVSEAMAMVYVTDLARATATGESLARALDGLPLVVVQSVERALPAGESTFAAGRAASLAQWRELAARLAAQPGFAGIAVQSLEDWDEGAP